MRITVLGGTGYTGGNIVREAASRGHEVISYSRNLPEVAVDGVSYETGSLLDSEVQAKAVENTDVVVAALAPRGELADELRALYARLAKLSASAGTRFGVIGGFNALRPAAGQPRFIESGEVPAAFAAEAQTMVDVLDDLQTSAPEGLDWFFVSPAAGYGSHAPGEATGNYRIGGEVALFDDNGDSAMSGTDFALALVDDLEKSNPTSGHISIAY